MMSKIIYKKNDWKLICNPLNLDSMDSCRGVILLNGDLYLENYSNSTIHNDILRILYSNNILKGEFIKNWTSKLPNESGFLTVQQLKKSNIIAIGESNKLLYNVIDWANKIHNYNAILNNAKIKNPKIYFCNKLIGVKLNVIDNKQFNIIS